MLKYVRISNALFAFGLLCMPSQAQESGLRGTDDTDSAARGVIRSVARAEIGTELIAPIKSIPYRDGQKFGKGDTLVAFSCERYEAEKRSASAVVQAKNLDYKAKKLLRSKNAIGKFDVDVAGAQLAEARANLEALQVRLDQCTIKAPFAGRIIEIRRQQFEFSRPNEPLLAIVNDQNLEIDIIVSSTWLSWMRAGQSFAFTVDETGKTLNAEIIRIGAEVDAVSQTIKITGLFTQKPDNLLPGMSGSADFSGSR